MNRPTAFRTVLTSVAALVAAAALVGCAAPDGEDAEASADAVRADDGLDAWNKAQALAPLLQDAVISAPIGVYFMPDQQSRMVGITDKAACYLTRLTGWRHDRQLGQGSAFLIDSVSVAHGSTADGSAKVDGVGGFLDERASNGSHGRSAGIKVTCLGLAPGYTPTIEDIAAVFSARGGMFVGLELPKRAPAPAR